MADNNMNKTPENETKQREQATTAVGGNDRKTEDGSFSGDRKPEQAGIDKDRANQAGREKSAIGGEHTADKSQADKSQADKSQATSQGGQFDKNRSEPASR